MKRRGRRRSLKRHGSRRVYTSKDLKAHIRLLNRLRREIHTSFVLFCALRTDGCGLWSNHKTVVHLKSYTLLPCSRALGELRVYFNRRDWSTKKHGLIYTDKLFLRELKAQLLREGFSEKAVRGVHYSEQGMQGDDYVSLDAGESFTTEYMSRLRPEVVYRVMSAEMERQDEVERGWRIMSTLRRRKTKR